MVGDFDTINEAEDYMLSTETPRHEHENVVLKRQSRNQWWYWDQGWQPMEVQEVRLARKAHARELEEAQFLVTAAVALEQDAPSAPTHDVNWSRHHAQARMFRAQALVRIEQAEIRLLDVVLEAHGNVEWPMVD